MACKARLKGDSVYQTGPYDPGVSASLGQIHVKNIGDKDGAMNVRVYEHPDILLDEFSIYLRSGQDLTYPITGGPVPDDPGGIWRVGVKVWCQTANEPSWSNTNKTHQWDVDIAVPPVECSEGDKEILEYCPDGVTVKKKRVCKNGVWVTKTYDCPEPECSEGDKEILEYCPDGVTVKKKRVCRNGVWVTKTYDCPPEPECAEGDTEVIEYCPDGYTVKKKRICKNGVWVTKTYDCPECYEGEREVLEWCPDGYNIRRERVCEDGVWVEYDYDCPGCSEGDSEVLEYCPDGVTVKRERRCEDGVWNEYDYDCPAAPPPDEDEETIIGRVRRRVREVRERIGLE